MKNVVKLVKSIYKTIFPDMVLLKKEVDSISSRLSILEKKLKEHKM